MAARNAQCGNADNTPTESTAEARVIEANRVFYCGIAANYDRYDGYGFDSYLQQFVKADLDRIGSTLISVSLGRTLQCLDCGGGTGNLALAMLERGWKVTVVDVSAEMLSLLRKKAHARGYSPTLINSSIEQFLSTNHNVYDLVGFNSVLHHLYGYGSVVQRAGSCIRAGGFFYSICDPVIPKHPFWSRLIDSIDVALAKILLDRADVLPGIVRRIRKLFSPKDTLFGRAVVSPGDIAEYHGRTGVDDEQVLLLLQKSGCVILEHTRFATGRTIPIRFLNKRARFLESFKIIAQRNGPVQCQSL